MDFELTTLIKSEGVFPKLWYFDTRDVWAWQPLLWPRTPNENNMGLIKTPVKADMLGCTTPNDIWYPISSDDHAFASRFSRMPHLQRICHSKGGRWDKEHSEETSHLHGFSKTRQMKTSIIGCSWDILCILPVLPQIWSEERSRTSVNQAEGAEVVITLREQLFRAHTHIPFTCRNPQATINTAQPDNSHTTLGCLHPGPEVQCQHLTNAHICTAVNTL